MNSLAAHRRTLILGAALFAALPIRQTIAASALQIDARVHAPATQPTPFHFGTARRPDGPEILANGASLLRDGKPWFAAMGEFHYSRYPESEWRDELLKMKAGGIDIVSTYVFWIHHEEIEGQFDWTGQRDLRKFVSLCRELNLPMILRIGPWDHGEVRNGGFPDWLMKKGLKLRSDDPKYMAEVKILYDQIAGQLKGLLWKDGGPVIGIQVENEYSGRGQHLVNLKNMAVEAGFDVPLYTRTGWPNLKTPIPFGQLLPMFGGYAEGFWDRTLAPMPGNYWMEYRFAPVRTDTAVGTDQLGNRAAKDEGDALKYPYVTCELGGGMANSYHRRILISPQDVESLVLVKIGSGSNLVGYYMYHGGTNPDGKLSTLQESQASNYPNDLPVKTYDFNAPLGEFGQERESYHRLRRLHLFLQDFGPDLTTMPPILPPENARNKTDTATVRWSVRTNGNQGYLFVNNYQRLQPMPAKPGLQFDLQLNGGNLRIPSDPATIPADSFFFWPFNIYLAGANLIYATAQPVCKLEDQGKTYVVFAETPGVPAEFVFDAAATTVQSSTGTIEKADGRIRIRDVKPGTGSAIELTTTDNKKLTIVLLGEKTSLDCWKGSFAGRDRIVLSNSPVVFDDSRLRVQTTAAKVFLNVLPASPMMEGNVRLKPATDGVFQQFETNGAPLPTNIAFEVVRAAGPVREIKKGRKGVSEAPSDSDFEQAAVWRIKLPPNTDPNSILRINYVGDVARLELNGKLLTDNFYNGTPFDLGLLRFAPEITKGELLLRILPLAKDAPIYLPREASPDFGQFQSMNTITNVQILAKREVEVSAASR